jgi:hypothetical protein
MKQDSAAYLEAAVKAGLSIRGKFTTEVSLKFAATMGWTNSEFARLKSLFRSEGIDIFASINKVDALNKEMQSAYEVGTTPLLTDGSRCAFVRITDLLAHL